MQGHYSESAGHDVEFGAAAARGRAAGRSVATDLVIDYPDLGAVLADPGVPGEVTGQVVIPALGDEPLEVTAGQFTLLVPDPHHVETDNMRYRLELVARDGSRYLLEGYKVIRRGSVLRSWGETTTLRMTLYQRSGADVLTVRYRGELRVSVTAVVRLVASIEIRNVANRVDRERYRCEFVARFLGWLWPFYAGVLDERERFPIPPREAPALPRPGGLAADMVRWCDGAGGWHDEAVPDACSRLVRYRGGTKGPVLLAPGFAMSATSFALATNRPSLVEYLVDHGFDVWLFDYRAGIELPSAWEQGTIDDIATIDWPRAVGEVTRITGREDVQAIGHCVGSVSLMMTLLYGTTGIRSAMCSQFTVHPVTSRLNLAKASLHLGTGLAAAGIRHLGPDTAWNARDVALDLAIRPVPVPRGERCGLATCRWINAVFGTTHLHAQLDDATHRQIPNLFGVANLAGLRHLILILQRGRAVDAGGLDRYLPHVDRLDLPIHFLAGTRNYIFRPQGTERTLAWLTEAFGRERAARNFSVTYLDGYAHLDALIGRDAATDVFPGIVEFLEATAAR